MELIVNDTNIAQKQIALYLDKDELTCIKATLAYGECAFAGSDWSRRAKAMLSQIDGDDTTVVMLNAYDLITASALLENARRVFTGFYWSKAAGKLLKKIDRSEQV